MNNRAACDKLNGTRSKGKRMFEKRGLHRKKRNDYRKLKQKKKPARNIIEKSRKRIKIMKRFATYAEDQKAKQVLWYRCLEEFTFAMIVCRKPLMR